MNIYALEQGDVTAAVLYILRNNVRLNTEYPGVQVRPNLIGFQRGQPWITVIRRGGTPSGRARVTDRARIDIDTYGPDRTTTHRLAAMAKNAVFNAIEFRGFGLCITDVDSEQGLNELPDPKTHDDRVFQTLAVHTAATPGVMIPNMPGFQTGHGPPTDGTALYYLDLDTGIIYAIDP